ncbi:MAG: cell division ATP-binding protein FtsE [Deltaproteobacteria bacterium]|jgi:cell division transport system ATP-binding protein|nr:cell division ATP-binding protein FtsE [Deltaproteobacteria bacterium]MBK9365463.1 cell division ATP-binding protein FtsE [Deltaproteobacteria bacterium]MBK9646391.1 cell division ATP-binding protein FtsE [Deltaproteobacteria bacterium]
MIRLYHVSKSYGSAQVLHDVTFRLSKGEFAYLTGASGAGKSTLLKLLYGAEAPTSGKLLVGGVDASKLGPARLPLLRRNLGVIFQDFKLIPNRTVFDNVGLALEVIGAERREISRRVNAVLNVVGLGGKGERRPLDLSGGEQQRVAIARAIVNDPAVLLADEPTGNLDGAMAVEVMEILLSINLRGTTVLIATHDIGLMERFPHRRLRLNAGRMSE